MKWVYVYLNSAGRVVYVGSGHFDRMFDHTKPHQMNHPNNNSPFNRWLREGNEWTRFRVLGPVPEAIAHCWEQALIVDNFGTVLNVRAANNGHALRPILGGPRTPYGPRSESGKRRVRRVTLQQRGIQWNTGSGVYREGNAWRTVITINGRRFRRRFKLYCDALRWRLEKEKEKLDSKSRGGIIEVEGRNTWNHSVSIEIDPPG